MEHKRVYAEVNIRHIEENLEGMYELTGRKSKIMAVIKTDGYGHGALPIAEVLEKKDYIHGYAVATIEEAAALRHDGIKKPILILGYTFPDCYDQMAAEDIRPAVFREDSLPLLGEAALKQGKTIKVHVKVDTGMSRIGITPDDEGLRFIQKLLKTDGIELEGIFTHFARADEYDKTWAYKQLRLFDTFVKRAEDTFGISIPYKHCANSASILEIPEAHRDLVRAGITMYGLWPSDEVSRDSLALKPALSLYSHIVYIKEILPGSQVSYGGTFTAKVRMRIATIPVGYGDGYPRGLSNKGYILIHGKKAPILGRVCMDQFMADVTDIPEAKMDDRVTLIGEEGGIRITMEELGDISGRFNYELACDLGKRIPRAYVYQE